MPYIITLVSLFSADSIMKCLVEKNIIKNTGNPAGKKTVIKKYHNKGAMMNIGETNQRFIALLSLVFSAFVTGIFVATLGMKGKALLKTGLSLILGGAYSNTYDRLKRKYVVDYISFRIDTERCRGRFLKRLAGRFNAIVYNISDFGILLGAMLTLISGL